MNILAAAIIEDQIIQQKSGHINEWKMSTKERNLRKGFKRCKLIFPETYTKERQNHMVSAARI